MRSFKLPINHKLAGGLYITLITFFFSSCVVTNSIYLTEADPCGDDLFAFGGFSTGVAANMDSVSDDGEYHFSNRYTVVPSIVLGAVGGISDQVNLRFSIHGWWGSAGAELGSQYSFFPKHTIFNCAIGAQLGISGAFDSSAIFNASESRYPPTHLFMHAAMYVPFGFELSDKVSLNITPRISYLKYQLNRYNDYSERYVVRPITQTLTMSLRFKKPSGFLYTEISAMQISGHIIPSIGVAWMDKY